MEKKRKDDILLAFFIMLFTGGVFLFNLQHPIDVSLWNSSSLSYERARVLEVIEEEAKEDESTPGRYYGRQSLRAVILNGDWKGREVMIENYLSTTHNVRLHTGQTFIACIDRPENAESLVTVYNYNRVPFLCLFAGILTAVMILVGKWKGLRSIISLIFTMYAVLAFMLPLIFYGYSPIVACIITVIITAGVSLFLLNGNQAKTWAAILATGIGVILSGVIFQIMARFIHVSGFHTDQAEALILISQNTGLKISEVLFAGILIASLGAVMDVGMSVASSLYEIKLHKPELNRKEVFSSGIHIGEDMLGTMCNTLILAFTGSSLTVMLMLLGYGVTFSQVMNSDFIAVEVAQGISGTIAIVLTVPIAAAVSAQLFCGGRLLVTE